MRSGDEKNGKEAVRQYVAGVLGKFGGSQNRWSGEVANKKKGKPSRKGRYLNQFENDLGILINHYEKHGRRSPQRNPRTKDLGR